ncbi:MAG: UDP-N-acetylmuramoyl-L-alanyl-D-glutamate--2,6-diaminopimelate ligase [SAR324 cluster bacterium]|nr:UDP-N-acetylmuramoyl-L-alanyl-D-glutamate--2,6-diaminopimelate ligase [SAR324 cluster bacterium]
MRLKTLAQSPLIIASRVLEPDCDLRELACDSTAVRPGTAFYALKGLRVDGHAYIEPALAAGAPVLFVSDKAKFEQLRGRPREGLAGLFLLSAGRAALADLSVLLFENPSEQLTLLGVTGTNGKTTVTHFTAQLYEALGKRCGVIGSLGLFMGAGKVGSERTTPEAPVINTFLRRCLSEGIGRVAMETTSIGITLERTRNLVFNAAAFTNLTQDHLDFHGSIAAYTAAKQRLFLEYDTSQAVINLDDPVGLQLADRLRKERPEMPVLTHSLARNASLRVENVESSAGGSRGLLRFGEQQAAFETSLLGRFNLSNLLTALGLLLASGEDFSALATAVSACRGVAGRFEQVPCGRPFTVVVDYAHTPDALENALMTARQFAAGRVDVVFGCGGERDAAKRPMMGEAAGRLADRVIITSDNPRGENPQTIISQIAAGLHASGVKAEQIVERGEAIRMALHRAGEGDVVLIAGKGHEAYQEISGTLHPFDDREVVREWARSQSAG